MDNRLKEQIYAGVVSFLITVGGGLLLVITYLIITRVTIPMAVDFALGRFCK